MKSLKHLRASPPPHDPLTSPGRAAPHRPDEDQAVPPSRLTRTERRSWLVITVGTFGAIVLRYWREVRKRVRRP